MRVIQKSLRYINWRLYCALLVMGFCPTIYTTVRTYLLGQLPGEWAYSIAGQLSWVNLLYEVIDEAFILPLYFFVGRLADEKEAFVGRLKTGLIAVGAVYALLAAGVLCCAEPLLHAMAASPDILAASAAYIRIESVAKLFGGLYSFACVALVAVGTEKPVYILTGVKLLLCLLADAFLVSSLPCSAQLGVNGIGVSDLLVHATLLVVVLILLSRQGYPVFSRARLTFDWMREFARVGGVSGAESLVRNAAYLLMVSRMVNMVGEQGTYWVANNFIWGWLLLPILQLGELIKRETARDEDAVKTHTLGYFTITGVVCLMWLAAIPLYRPFMRCVLGFDDVEKLFRLVMLLLGSYVLFAIQNVFDATFYGRGKTGYMLFEAVITNSIYYGVCFVLYRTGAWVPTLHSIALMFALGNAFDSVVSGIAYAYYLKRHGLRLLANGG